MNEVEKEGNENIVGYQETQGRKRRSVRQKRQSTGTLINTYNSSLKTIVTGPSGPQSTYRLAGICKNSIRII